MVPHAVGKPPGLDQRVQAPGRQRRGIRGRDAIQDGELDQRRDALPVRRDLQEAHATIVGAFRIDPVGGNRGEIVLAEETAEPLDSRHDLGGYLALVEGLRSAGCDGTQRRCERREAEPFSFARRPSVDKAMARAAFVLREVLDIARPVPCDPLVDREAVLGIADRVGEQRIEAARAEAAKQRLPRLDGSRYRHRMRACLGDFWRIRSPDTSRHRRRMLRGRSRSAHVSSRQARQRWRSSRRRYPSWPARPLRAWRRPRSPRRPRCRRP